MYPTTIGLEFRSTACQARLSSFRRCLLIEGLDCSGKKTTARLLQQKILSHGIPCIVNIGGLGSKRYQSVARFVSSRKCSNFVRSLVYSIDGYRDYLWYRRFSTQIVIQVSSPMRSWAYAHINKKYWNILLSIFFKSQLPEYDNIWYLTAKYEDRLVRHKFQSEQNENPDVLEQRFTGKNNFEEMEVYLKRMLKLKGLNEEYNSSIYSSDEITTKMLEYLVCNYPYLFDSNICQD
jgi:hypothetical protein